MPSVRIPSAYAPISTGDEALLDDACHRSRDFPPNYDLILEGDVPGPVLVILSGWACRYKILPSGSRQIISFMMPCDFCDMHVAVSVDASIDADALGRVLSVLQR